MTAHEKFMKIMETGVTEDDLWFEIRQWLSEDTLSEFADHYASMYDIDLEED